MCVQPDREGLSSVNCDRKARSDLPHGDRGKRLGHVKAVDWKFGVGKVKDHVSIGCVSRFEDELLDESIGSAVSGEVRVVAIVFDGLVVGLKYSK